MNKSLQPEGLDTSPWFRQFWPWFVIALPATAVIASFVTLWIAVGAAPERIDGFGAMAVSVEMTADRRIVIFDLGARSDEAWPAYLNVTLISQTDGTTQRLQAQRFDEHYYEGPVTRLTPGAHDVIVEDEESTLRLRGTWAYPAPVWKLRIDD